MTEKLGYGYHPIQHFFHQQGSDTQEKLLLEILQLASDSKTD